MLSFTNLIKLNRSLRVLPLFFLNKNDIHFNQILCDTKQPKQNNLKKFITKKAAVVIKPTMTIKELAFNLNVNSQHIFDCLTKIGYHFRTKEDYVLNNVEIIIKIVKLCGMKHRFEDQKEVDYNQIEKDLKEKDKLLTQRKTPDIKNLIQRPPVVTIMGHVDHGKTTLLDSLRGTNVVASEFGGITQHIGAFNCRLSNSNFSSKEIERNITFLDTPGHAAFSSMRLRGAKLTDIVVLVIAAEDGVMAQTIESIQHAKETNCQIIVAINKIDKVNQDQINKVKRELLKYDLIPEENGGEVQVVPISALKKTNLDILKEEIWTKAEIMDLKGDPKGFVEGYIIESTQDNHKGNLATVLIQRGTLKKGDYIIAGNSWCKVRSILDENTKNLTAATLSQAVQVMGWKDLPIAGDKVYQLESENKLKELVDIRSQIQKINKLKIDSDVIKKKRVEEKELYNEAHKTRILTGRAFINNFYTDRYIKRDKLNEKELLNKNRTISIEEKKISISIIIKTDVNGSMEAILDVLDTYNEHDKVNLDLIHFEVGQVKQSDIEMASTFGAIIYCFNLPAANIEANGIQIKNFNVIYKMFDDLLEEINKKAPVFDVKDTLGEAKVIQLFDFTEDKKKIKVIGGLCVDGVLQSAAKFMIIRNEEIIAENLKCKSLKNVKTDVNQIKKNVSFGLSLENESILPQPGDKIVCYNLKKVKQNIEWKLGF